MSYDTYAGILEEIEDELSRGDLAPKLAGWMNVVEKECVLELRDLREIQLETTGTFIVDQNFVTLPAGITALRMLRIESDPARRVAIVSIDKWHDVTEQADASGTNFPIAVTWNGERKLLLAPPPGSADTFTLFYLGTLDPASQSRTTSQILREAPTVLVEGVCMKAQSYLRDTAEEAKRRGKYEAAKFAYGQFLFRARASGGELRIRPDTMPSDVHTTWDFRR